jgi:hypothetical protein
MPSSREFLSDFGLVTPIEGRRRAFYWRVTSPGADSSRGETRCGLAIAVFLLVAMGSVGVFGLDVVWRIIGVAGACLWAVETKRIWQLLREEPSATTVG